jgi:uncharacterized protein (DUF302 family)
MFLENESLFGFDETVERLTTEIANRSWRLSATHDLQQVLKSAGTDVLPVKVLALCHPKHSGKILSLDDERIVSSLMPCRISIYNKSNGKTYVSRLNTAAFTSSMAGITGQVMAESGNDVETIVNTVIKAK